MAARAWKCPAGEDRKSQLSPSFYERPLQSHCPEVVLNGRAGGGIYNYGGTVNMNSGSSITDNTAASGGGIYNAYWGTVNMYAGSSITGNTANGAYSGGGGIHNVHDSTTNMYAGSSITGNTAEFGGGIYNTNGVGGGPHRYREPKRRHHN
jgi:hypothetical protein